MGKAHVCVLVYCMCVFSVDRAEDRLSELIISGSYKTQSEHAGSQFLQRRNEQIHEKDTH